MSDSQPDAGARHRADNLVWIDLEMTGLDPRHDAILQAALIVTDASLQVLEEFACDVWQPEGELAKMTPFVRDMHERNGLIERVRASRLDLRGAERELLARVSAHCAYPATLCGNSVGTDKQFIDAQLPGLGAYLHYRIVDVSSLKVLAALWYGDQALYAKPSEGEHDALVDIRNSIAELRHYRETLWRSS